MCSQARLNVSYPDARVEGRKRRCEPPCRVALDDHPVRLLLRQHVRDAGEDPGREVRESLSGCMTSRSWSGRMDEELEDFGQASRGAAPDTDPHLAAVGLTKALDHRGELIASGLVPNTSSTRMPCPPSSSVRVARPVPTSGSGRGGPTGAGNGSG